MSALTKDRDTKEKSGQKLGAPAAATKKFYAGAIVMLDASGNATPGATATTLKPGGRCCEQVDNSSGAAGDETVEYEKGVFHFANSTSTDEITRADITNNCYVVDDQTVAKTSGSNTRSIAGKIFDVDDAGVWVDFR